MTVQSLFRQLHGSREFLFAVEGIPRAVSSCFAQWNFGSPPADAPIPTDWIIIRGCLNVEGLKSSQSVSLDNCELKASDLTFELVDGEDEDGEPFAVSALMSREGAAIGTTLTATLTEGAVADMEVESSASPFPASGDVFVGLETIGYDSKADGTHFTTLTRGKYGSRARQHTVEAPSDIAMVADYGQIPEVTDRATSTFGRRCWLYMAEVKQDGSLDVAEIIWRGRITGELTAGDDMTWHVPAESLVSALSTDLLGSQPTTVVKGILIENDTVLTYRLTEEIGALERGVGQFPVLAGTYADSSALLAHITDQMASSMDADAFSDDRWTLFEDDGKLNVQKVRDDVASCFCEVFILDGEDQLDSLAIGLVLGIVVGVDFGILPTLGDPLVLTSLMVDFDGVPFVAVKHRVPMALYMVGSSNFYIPVERKDGFTAYTDEDLAEGWVSKSIVTIGGTPYVLETVHATESRLLVHANVARADVTAQWAVQYVGESPIEVRQGIYFRGDLPLVWRDAVLDNANVPEAMVIGADSRDFDWDDLEAQFPGGNISRRERWLTGPVSFLSLLLEDFAYAGLCPILGLDGRITARPLNNTSLVRPDGEPLLAIDAESTDESARPELSRSPKRIVNRYSVHVVRDLGRPYHASPPLDLEVLVNDKTSQARHRMVRSVERDFSGAISTANQATIAADVFGVASTLFALLSRETDELPVGPCNGLAYGVLPLDTVLVTHWLPPDPTNSGERGLVALPALVLGVEYNWFACEVSLTLQLLVDGGQRSGFAPEARIDTYVDHGAGTEPRRYELSLQTGRYCPADVEEGQFFPVGFKVAIRQRDVDTITVALEEAEVTDADPDAVFIDVPLGAGMAAEANADRAALCLADYDEAGQAALALLYLFVADAPDDRIGASGVLGYHPS